MSKPALQEFPRPEPKRPQERVPHVEEAARFLNQAIPFSLAPRDHERSVKMLVDYLARSFDVERDEVAFLILDKCGQNLFFASPTHLAAMKCSFSYDRLQSIAGKSLWDQQTYVENQLPAVNHLSYFERARRNKSTPARIEKMLTFPIYVGSSPVGVVQISRKKTVKHSVRENFQTQDTGYLKAIEGPLLRLFQGIRSVCQPKRAVIG